MVFAAGTQHVLYALLPVIAEVSRQSGVRPERPLSASVVAAQCGVIASPIAAATVAFAGLLVGTSISLSQILTVTVPATLIGLSLATLSVAFRGRELADDPEYQQRLADGRITAPAPPIELTGDARRKALGSCIVFIAAVTVVIAIGLMPSIRPVYETVVEGVTETGQVEMGRLIMIVMLAAAGVITIAFGTKPDAIVKSGTMRGGMVALISILGVSWLGSSFIEANKAAVVGAISSEIQAHPWIFAAGMFTLSVLLFSRAAAVVTLVPVGLALGLPPYVLLGSFTAANGTFFLPAYGTVLAAVSFDQTGSTRIGTFLLDHSFMRPGLVATLSATVVATLLARWLFG
jgi:anaerobic C4-dicarboxylate transporter DcuA